MQKKKLGSRGESDSVQGTVWRWEIKSLNKNLREKKKKLGSRGESDSVRTVWRWEI